MTLKRIFIAFLFIIAASHIFSFAFIKDISDWEKDIKRLNCVESLEVEKLYPNDDESVEYNMKIYLTENRYIQISCFAPYINKNNNFYIDRIGDLVPVVWGYSSKSGNLKPKSYNYKLGFYFFRFKYLCRFGNFKSLIDLIKYYDEALKIINDFPNYNIAEKDYYIDEYVGIGEKPFFELWNIYLSPYIYSNYDEKSKTWEEYKLYKMTVENYNDYIISRGLENLILEENP